MSAPTLPELIERIRESGGSLTIELALTEIDRRLTALEERTAPPLSGNEVTTNLLRAAKEARAKAVEDGLAVLEGRTTITCTCHRIDSWDGTVRGFEPIDGCAMHGNRPEDIHAREAFAEAWKARKQGAESEPAEDDRAKLRARVDAAGAEFTAHVACGGPPLTPRAMYERAHALTLDGDTDNGAGVWELQEECVREGWETLFEEATQGEREAHALLDRVITEVARAISPELRADIDRALDRARGGSST